MATLYRPLEPLVQFSNAPTGKAVLQKSVGYDSADVGKYVAAFIAEGSPYLVTEVFEDSLPYGWINGLDDQKRLADTVVLFDSLDAAQSVFAELSNKAFYRVEIDEDNNIRLEPVD